MFITMKLLGENMSLGQFWWTSNLGRWMLFDLGHSDKFFDRTILFLGRVGQEIIGQRDTTRKVPSWSILSWMSSEKKLKVVIVYKVNLKYLIQKMFSNSLNLIVNNKVVQFLILYSRILPGNLFKFTK